MATYFGHLLPEVKNRADKIAAGSNHNVLLTHEGKIYNWGDNTRGQLGNGTTVNSSTATIVNPIYLENPNAYSVYFDGTDDTLSWPEINLTGDFTVEGWLYKTANDASPYTVFVGSSSNTQFFIDYTTKGSIGLYGGGAFIIGASGSSITINNWHYLTWTRSGTTVRAFVDGILLGTGTSSATLPVSVLGYSLTGYEINGYVSSFRIVKGTAVYTSNFTPPTSPLTAIPGTVLLTCQNATFKDNSENNFTITVAGNSSPSTVSPFNYSLKTSTYGDISAASSTTAAISVDGELLMWGDNSSNQIGITSSTSVTLPSQIYAPSPASYSVYFDGTGDELTIVNNAAFNFGSGDFTIECWFYLTGNTPLDGALIRPAFLFGPGQSVTNEAWFLSVSGNNTLTGTGILFQARNTSGTPTSLEYTSSIEKNTWYHAVATRRGNILRLFLNGINVAENTNWTLAVNSGGNAFRIARRNVSTNYEHYFPGYISNVRVIKGSCVYADNFELTTDHLQPIPGTVLLTCQSSRFRDNSQNNFTVTAVGNSTCTNFNPFETNYNNLKFSAISLGNTHTLALDDNKKLYAWGNNASGQLGNGTTVSSAYPREITITSTSSYSVFFDGSGDYLTLSGIPLTSAVTEFTIEAWIYPTSNANQSYIYAQYSGSDARRTTFYRETNTTINFFHPDIGTNIVKSSSTENNVWLHVAVTRDSSNTLRLFVNGKLEYTYNNFTNYLQQINGQIGGVGASYFVGYISNLRVVNKALYISDFIPSSTPLTATDETVLLICQDSNINNLASNSIRVSETFGDLRVTRFSPFTVINKFKSISAGNGYSLALTENNELYAWGENSSGQLGIGNTTDQALPVKVYNPVYDYSVYFDGSGDWLSVVDTGGVLAHGPNNFTYEYWIKPTGSFSTGYVMHQYGSVIDGINIVVNSTTGVVTANFRATNQADIVLLSPADAIVIGRWSHVAIMRNGATLVLAVNGNVYSVAISASTLFLENQNSLSTPLRFGSKSNLDTNYFKGYISNARIIRGRALYTTAYNVPTEPFTLTDDTVFLGLQSPTLVDKGPFNFKLTATGNTVVAADESPFLDNANKWNNLASGNSHTFAITKNQELYATGDGTSRKLGNEFVTVASSFLESTEYLGSSVEFNGTSYLTSTVTAPTTGDFTYECWFFVTSLSATRGLFNTRSGATTDGFNVYLNTSGQILIGHTSVLFTAPAKTAVYTNKWYHLAVIRVGANIKVFLNYGLIGTYSITTTSYTSSNLNVGCNAQGANGFIGYISNFRYLNKAIYNDDGIGIPKSYSVYFDGSGDYLSIPTTSTAMHQLGDWTYECWIYFNALPTTGYQNIFGQGASGQNSFGLYSANATANSWAAPHRFKVNQANIGDRIVGTTSVNLNTWYHLALVRNSGVVTLYVNGVAEGSPFNNSTNYTFNNNPLLIGNNSICYISNFRFVQGTAIYTSNFTPPTSPLTAIENTSLLTCQDAIFKDSSSNNFTITVAGNSIVRHFNPFGFNKIAPLTVTSSTIFLTCNSNFLIDASTNNFAITSTGTPSVSDLGPFKNKIFAKQAAVGGGHSLIIDSNNKLRSFGLNSSGQLGSTRNYEIVELYKTDYYSNYFDGSGDQLTVPASSSLDLTGDFTIEFWVNAQASSYMVCNGTQTGSGCWYFYFNASTGVITYAMAISTWAGLVITTPNNSMTTNTWTHIALTRAGSSFKLFVNGVVKGSSTNSGSLINTGRVTQIGYYTESTGTYYFTGYISNLRIIKGTAVYTSEFIPPTSPLTAIANTSLLTCQSSTIKDNSTNNFTITVSGNTAISKFAPNVKSQNERIQDTRLIAAGAEHSFIYTQNRINNFYRTAGNNTSYQLGDNTTINKSSFITTNINQSYSVFYDGASDYLIYPNSTQFGLGTGDFTIEMWVYVYAVNDINWLIDFRTSGGGAAQVKPELAINNAGGIDYMYGNANFIAQTVTGLVTANAWHHIALVRNSGTSKIYYNGIEKDSKPDTIDFGTSATVTLGTVGDSPGYTTTEFNGFMSNARVVKGTAIYTSNFTPPTRPLTAIPGTSLLVCQDDVFRDNSVNNFSVTKSGEIKTSTFNPFVILD